MLPSRPRILLPVAHSLQQYGADCLPACALMVLTYLGHSMQYRHLMRILNTQEFGTPFSNLYHLNRLGITVTVDSGTIDLLYEQLAQNRPCIVAVQTAELPHWPYPT